MSPESSTLRRPAEGFHAPQLQHAVPASHLHAGGVGGTGRAAARQARPAAGQSARVPVQTAQQVHGSGHQPGQGESRTCFLLEITLFFIGCLTK